MAKIFEKIVRHPKLVITVFLLHRFQEVHSREADPQKAMVMALTQSTSSIAASGLTTVIGFLALCLMRFRIGPDLGLALAKGVAISLVTVFVFMPVFILSVYKWIEKSRHRPIVPSFEKFGRLITKIMIPAVCIFSIAIVPAFMASNSNSFYYGASHLFGTDTKAGSDREAVIKVFGEQDTYVLMIPKDGDRAYQKQLAEDIEALPHVTGVISYAGTARYIPGQRIPLFPCHSAVRAAGSAVSDRQVHYAQDQYSKIKSVFCRYLVDKQYYTLYSIEYQIILFV